MEKSNTINELAQALHSVQAEMPAVEQNSVNPFLKNRFADLGAVISASVPVLEKHGLSISQFPTGGNGVVGVTTVLMHTSGQYIADTISLEATDEKGKSRAQVAGSIITYLRRYAWSAVLGLYTEEDNDGGTRVERLTTKRQQAPSTQDANSDGDYIDVTEVGVFETQNGKRHIGFMAEGNKWPDVRWWAGRDALIEAAPWIVNSATKEQLGEIGNRFPFAARIYYTINDKGYKDVERVEPLGDDVKAALDDLGAIEAWRTQWHAFVTHAIKVFPRYSDAGGVTAALRDATNDPEAVFWTRDNPPALNGDADKLMGLLQKQADEEDVPF